MFHKYLEEVNKKRIEIYKSQLNEGATENAIAEFKNRCNDFFSEEIPEEYYNLLRTVNGIEYDGVSIYGIDDTPDEMVNQHVYGFIDYNMMFYDNEWLRKYVFFGEGGISWYVYDIEEKKYYLLDCPSGSVVRECNSFDEIICVALKEALGEEYM